MIHTQGIKYTGSKLKLLPYIKDIVSGLDIKKVLDGFSGTTRVSQLFASLKYETTSNDVSEWSRVFGNTYLKNQKEDSYYQEIIEHLNNVRPVHGWFSEKYGGSIHETKKPFQLKNTRKLDGIREEIDRLKLDEIEESVILTSLILALDSIDSTIGHYVAYLNKWSSRSYHDLILKLPQLTIHEEQHCVIQDDIFNTIRENSYDLVYFDPPYGSNNIKMPSSRVRYNSYYHIWKTVILNDKPKVFGVANRREDSRDDFNPSIFEEYRKNKSGDYIAMDAIRRLIEQTHSHYILLSYSNTGRATKEQLLDVLNSNGNLIKVLEIDYQKNVMSNMMSTTDWIQNNGKYLEYMFLLEK